MIKSKRVLRHLAASFAIMSPLASVPSWSADIYLINGRAPDSKYIKLSGVIAKGDLAAVKSAVMKDLLESPSTVTVVLNSPGGDVNEAIAIGRYLRRYMATTEVDGADFYNPNNELGRSLVKDSKKYPSMVYGLVPAPSGRIDPKKIVRCYSACVLIFYAGVQRSVSDNVYLKERGQKPVKIPVMGLHRPYYDQSAYAKLSPGKAQREYAALDKEVRNYMLAMGASNEVVDRMFRTASNQIDLVPEKKFKKMFKAIAPFFQEWEIAKCKPFGPRAALSKADYDTYVQYQAAMKAAVKKHPNLPTNDRFGFFIVPGWDESKIARIYNEIDVYNSQSMACRTDALWRYQHHELDKQLQK